MMFAFGVGWLYPELAPSLNGILFLYFLSPPSSVSNSLLFSSFFIPCGSVSAVDWSCLCIGCMNFCTPPLVLMKKAKLKFSD